MARLANFDAQAATSATVRVQIIDPCLETTLIVDQELTKMTASILGEAVTQTFSVFPNSVAQQNANFGSDLCGLQEYSVMLQNGDGQPSFITVD